MTSVRMRAMVSLWGCEGVVRGLATGARRFILYRREMVGIWERGVREDMVLVG